MFETHEWVAAVLAVQNLRAVGVDEDPRMAQSTTAAIA